MFDFPDREMTEDELWSITFEPNALSLQLENESFEDYVLAETLSGASSF